MYTSRLEEKFPNTFSIVIQESTLVEEEKWSKSMSHYSATGHLDSMLQLEEQGKYEHLGCTSLQLERLLFKLLKIEADKHSNMSSKNMSRQEPLFAVTDGLLMDL